jgi:hypothetical protein
LFFFYSEETFTDYDFTVCGKESAPCKSCLTLSYCSNFDLPMHSCNAYCQCILYLLVFIFPEWFPLKLVIVVTLPMHIVFISLHFPWVVPIKTCYCSNFDLRHPVTDYSGEALVVCVVSALPLTAVVRVRFPSSGLMWVEFVVGPLLHVCCKSLPYLSCSSISWCHAFSC